MIHNIHNAFVTSAHEEIRIKFLHARKTENEGMRIPVNIYKLKDAKTAADKAQQ
jgi:hypothetical protein